ncbi:MAG: 4-coumarate--CoA ligase [Myxococcota bacterium]|jgi:4-coumarate--CoA ligase
MSVYASAEAPIEIPNIHLTEYVLQRADDLADKTAFIEGTSGRTLTYGTLANAIRALAGGLAARGVGRGTTWALMAPNLPEYAIAFHGLALCGATVTTLNPTYGASELAHQLKDAGATAVITIGMFLPVAKEAMVKAGIDEVFLIGDGDAPSITTLFGAPMTEAPALDYAEHVVALPYSSGTTGFPKGVMLTHRNLVANLVQSHAHLGLEEDDIIFAVLPFFHIYGMTVLMNLGLATGVTIVCVPRFDLPQMLDLVQTHRITRLYLVPPIVLALAKHPIVDNYDLSSVIEIFSGAAPLSGDLAEAAAKRLGCAMGQGYGMTELSPVSHAIKRGDYRSGSVGTLLPSTEARLVNPESGEDVAIGESGELWIRGPQVMKGYFGNDSATAATVDDDGWLHTGDVATVDADGHFAIVDRLKELIKYKGFQVPPAEIEALLINHPGVADVAVIGVPDAEAGELPKAFIVRAAGSTITEDAVKQAVSSQLASYKQIRLVEFIDTIPKSASGKILRRELRQPSS